MRGNEVHSHERGGCRAVNNLVSFAVPGSGARKFEGAGVQPAERRSQEETAPGLWHRTGSEPQRLIAARGCWPCLDCCCLCPLPGLPRLRVPRRCRPKWQTLGCASAAQ
eukprot:757896-Hanusia_phi.AAC.3